jgi:hypothetical protein
LIVSAIYYTGFCSAGTLSGGGKNAFIYYRPPLEADAVIAPEEFYY